MAFDAHVLKVLIASPGDTAEERDAVERSLHGWNASRAEREQVILLPRRWESDAVPRLGGGGQSITVAQRGRPPEERRLQQRGAEHVGTRRRRKR
jgi:hypothetical protein